MKSGKREGGKRKIFFTLQIAQKMAKSCQNQGVMTFGLVLFAIIAVGLCFRFCSRFSSAPFSWRLYHADRNLQWNFLAGTFRGRLEVGEIRLNGARLCAEHQPQRPGESSHLQYSSNVYIAAADSASRNTDALLTDF